MMDIDCLIVGAGVIGLAYSAQRAREGNSVTLVEQEHRIGDHASSRNSEAIHAAIYYPPGSLKARLCVEDRDLLYRWCEQHGVGHRRMGKLLAAVTESEVSTLEALQLNARRSGVDLIWGVPHSRI